MLKFFRVRWGAQCVLQTIASVLYTDKGAWALALAPRTLWPSDEREDAVAIFGPKLLHL